MVGALALSIASIAKHRLVDFPVSAKDIEMSAPYECSSRNNDVRTDERSKSYFALRRDRGHFHDPAIHRKPAKKPWSSKNRHSKLDSASAAAKAAQRYAAHKRAIAAEGKAKRQTDNWLL